MNIVKDEIAEYCERYSKSPSPVLRELERETHLKVLSPQMISGHIQGQFLKMISNMIRPETILEIGTFTGYSAICMASGLAQGGMLHTIEINNELESMIRGYIAKAGMTEKITLHIGDAREVITEIDSNFDMVFIDADKENYVSYYDLVSEKMKSGGYIIADNALWSGKVLENGKDKETIGIQAFNEKVRADERVENLLLPVRDGIMIARKL